MKNLLLLVLLIFRLSANAQTGGETFYSKEFNWTIELPAGFEKVSDAEWDRKKEVGLNAVEETLDADLNDILIPNKTLFVVKKGVSDLMEVNLQAFDPANDGDYEESVKTVWGVIAQTFKAKMRDAVVTHEIGSEVISNLKFLKSTIIITLKNNMKIYSISYNRLFGKKDFTMNIMYMNGKNGKLLMDAWKSSVFK